MAAERSQISMSEDIAIEQLEKRARWQRTQLHEGLSDLKFSLHQAFDAKQFVRRYFWQIVGAVSLTGVIIGYRFAGIFFHKE